LVTQEHQAVTVRLVLLVQQAAVAAQDITIQTHNQEVLEVAEEALK
jgi:uncharacterized protein YeaC (DUF1315 family)